MAFKKIFIFLTFFILNSVCFADLPNNFMDTYLRSDLNGFFESCLNSVNEKLQNENIWLTFVIPDGSNPQAFFDCKVSDNLYPCLLAYTSTGLALYDQGQEYNPIKYFALKKGVFFGCEAIEISSESATISPANSLVRAVRR